MIVLRLICRLERRMPTVAKKEGRDEGEDAIPEVGATSHRLVDDAVAVEALRMQLDELAREVDLGLEEAEAEAGAIRTSVRGPNQPTVNGGVR